MSSVWLKMQMFHHDVEASGGIETTMIAEGLLKFASPNVDPTIVDPSTTVAEWDAERIIGRSEFSHLSSRFISPAVLMEISREQMKINIGRWEIKGLGCEKLRKTSIEIENLGELEVQSYELDNGLEVNVGGFFRCRFMYFDGHFVDGVHPAGDILRGIPHHTKWLSFEQN